MLQLKYNNLILKIIILLSFILLKTSLIFAGEIPLSWDPPLNNADGSSINDLAGYKVYYGTSPEAYSNIFDVGNITTYVIKNLADGIYYIAITAYNTSNNESNFSNEIRREVNSSTIGSLSISGVYVTNITSANATINWTTSMSSTSQVEFGSSIYFGNTTIIDPSMTISHNQTLTELLPLTKYYYRILTQDSYGNIIISDNNYSFTTLDYVDNIPPSISNILVKNITESSVIITWMTSEPSTSQVDYGINSFSKKSTLLGTKLVTIHSVSIEGLSGNTTYEFKVKSKDGSDNEAISDNIIFLTSNIPPTIDSFSADSISGAPPLTVNFLVNSTDIDGFVEKYEWDFLGTGTFTEDISKPYYVYEAVGIFNVRVRAIDNSGEVIVSDILKIIVESPNSQVPSDLTITGSYISEEEPLSNLFTVTTSDSSWTIIKYEWDFDGNGIFDAVTTSQPVSYEYSAPGEYIVRVRVTNDKNETFMAETTITIKINKMNNVEQSLDEPFSVSSTSQNNTSDGTCFIDTAAYNNLMLNQDFSYGRRFFALGFFLCLVVFIFLKRIAK